MFTIGELAKAAGVPGTTIRFYERKGLLRPEGRSESNYRTYSPQSLQRLRFIVASKRAGFTLGDIARLLDLRSGQEDCCGSVQKLIETRLATLRERITELRHAEDVLDRSLGWCRNGGGGDDEGCPVLDELTRTPPS